MLDYSWFISASPEAIISITFAVFSLIISIVYSVLLPLGMKPWSWMNRLLENVVCALYYFGKFSLWIVAAIVIACIVPIFEQMESFSQMCGSNIFNQLSAVCGEKIRLRDFISDNHIHTFQIMIWFVCGFVCWAFLVKQIEVSIEKDKVKKRKLVDSKYELSFEDDTDSASTVKNTVFVIGWVFFFGAVIQQFLERYLIN